MGGKHTPGPWVFIPPVPFEGDDEHEAGGFVSPGGIEGSNGDPVCMFGDPSGSGTMFENAADHCLIAAAPEMAEALGEVIKWNAARGEDDEILPASKQAPEMAKAMTALAKALSPEGEDK